MGAISVRELAAMFPTARTVDDLRGPVRRFRARRSRARLGLGYEITPGSPFEDQYQAVEERPSWGASLPVQSFAATKAGAPALFYRFPATQSAFLNRSMQLPGGVTPGQVYSGEIQAGAPAGIQALLASIYPQLQMQYATPWKNPWSAEQFFGATPTGVPIWGGGVLQAFQPTQGVGPARMAVGVPGQGYPAPGTAIERF